MGTRSEFVVSGSDCGHVFIWSSASGKLVNLLKVCRSQHDTLQCLDAFVYLLLL
jgi:hypothetical protein